jgi:hypothetical protein
LSENSKKKVISFSVAAVAVLLVIGLMYFLPIQITIFRNPNGVHVMVFGYITKDHPLEKCLPAKLDLDGYRDVNVELLLATYNRINTSHYTFEFYDFDNGKKDLINETHFDAAGFTDNSYKSFGIQPVNAEIAKPCFRLKSSDATDQNAITMWMNSKSEPIVKITAASDMLHLFGQANGEYILLLQTDGFIWVYFVYFVSLIYLVIYLLTNRDGSKK